MRRQCEFPDCERLGRNKGYYKGKIRYDRFCEVHHRNRSPYYKGKQEIDNSKCENCGWNKTKCDRHRIIPERGYYRENVIVLCPNCHRLVTNGLLILQLP